jgi:hypothetical protein
MAGACEFCPFSSLCRLSSVCGLFIVTTAMRTSGVYIVREGRVHTTLWLVLYIRCRNLNVLALHCSVRFTIPLRSRHFVMVFLLPM